MSDDNSFDNQEETDLAFLKCKDALKYLFEQIENAKAENKKKEEIKSLINQTKDIKKYFKIIERISKVSDKLIESNKERNSNEDFIQNTENEDLIYESIKKLEKFPNIIEKRLKTKYNNLLESNESFCRYTYVYSVHLNAKIHDIKNIFNSILAYNELYHELTESYNKMIENKETDNETKNKIIKKIERYNSNINTSLTKLNRMSMKIMNPTIIMDENIKYKKTLNEVFLAHRFDTFENDIDGNTIYKNITGDATAVISPEINDITFVMDEDILYSMMDNTVGNALHYGRNPTTNECKLEIYIEQLDDEEWLCIKDNGPGIDKSILENFGKPGVTTKGNGYGVTSIIETLNQYGIEHEYKSSENGLELRMKIDGNHITRR